MKLTVWIKAGAVVVALAFAASVFVAWRDAQRQQAALQTELQNTQQALTEATARQTSRDAALNTLLAQLKKSKAEVQKPEQVVAALPSVLPLPEPVQLGGAAAGTDNKVDSGKGKPLIPQAASDKSHTGEKITTPPIAEFPTADLKPLYDFAVDCQACQAQLAAAQADLKDEQTKEQALGKERDDALKAAKGGSVLRRVARAAKWFAIGAAAGAIAAKAAR